MTLRADLSIDGEPIGAVEVFQEVDGKRRKVRVRLGDTSGATYSYTPPGGSQGGLRDGRVSTFAIYLQSALTKDWWNPRCPHCGSTDRTVRLPNKSWRERDSVMRPCPDYWHRSDS